MGIGTYRHRVELRHLSAPPVVMPTSTRWRMHYTESHVGTGWVGCAKLMMATSPAGADICTGGTPTASSVYSNHPVAHAFDADPYTYWCSGDDSTPQPLPQWLEYAFPTPVAIAEYRLQTDAFFTRYTRPRAWTFEYWDGAAWVVVDTQTGQVWVEEDDQSEIRTFAVEAIAPVVWDCSMQSVATQVVDGLAAFYIRGRFHPGITLETQILFEGRTFQVQAITDVDEKHVELQLYCVEVVGRA